MQKMKLFVYILFSIVLLAGLSSAATLMVNASASQACYSGAFNNYTTINSAITAAAAGDTIRVCGHHYTENINITVPINLFGNMSNVSIGGLTDNASIISINASDVNITNFTITGMGGTVATVDADVIGIEINASANRTHIYNVSINGTYNGFEVVSSKWHLLENNTVHNVTNVAYNLTNVSSSNITNSFIYNIVLSGIVFDFSATSQLNDNNTISGNNLSNFSRVGGVATIAMNLTNLRNTTVSSNRVVNATTGILLNQSNNNTLSSNIVFNNTLSNINLTNSHTNSLRSNTLNTSAIGILLQDSQNNTLSTNTGLYLTQSAFNLTNSTGNLLSSNTGNNNTLYGFVVSTNSRSTTLMLNTAENNSMFGYYLHNRSTVTLSENNASNNTLVGYNLQMFVNATFNATNGAYETPDNYDAKDVNISDSSNASTFVGVVYYNLSTSHGGYFFRSAENVSIVGLARTNATNTTGTGCSNTNGTACLLVTRGLDVVNITNSSGGATIDLGLYYQPNASTVDLLIGRFNNTGANGWVELGKTDIDKVLFSIRLDGIGVTHLNNMTFGAIQFAGITTTSASTSTVVDSSSSAASTFSVSHDFTCVDGSFEVSVGVSNAVVRLVRTEPDLIEVGQLTTDSSEEVKFTVTTAGTYKLHVSKSGYTTYQESGIVLSPCPSGSTPPSGTPQQPPAVQPPSQPPAQPPATPATDDAVEVLQSIEDAQALVQAAKAEGKSVVRAEELLSQAQQAYNTGDYARARDLVQSAVSAIEGAQPAMEDKPADVMEDKTADEVLEPPQAQGGCPVSLVLLVIGCIIFLRRQ